MNKKLKERVRQLLIEQPKTRDNDNLLISEIWYSESGFKSCLRFGDFLEDFEKGLYTSAESIRRARQKLQEDNESLRGEKYNERQRKGKEVRQTINK
jgi:hypothetical protein